MAFLDHRDRESLQREIVRAQAADDTATDDDDVRCRRQPCIAIDRVDRWGHGAAHNPWHALESILDEKEPIIPALQTAVPRIAPPKKQFATLAASSE